MKIEVTEARSAAIRRARRRLAGLLRLEADYGTTRVDRRAILDAILGDLDEALELDGRARRAGQKAAARRAGAVPEPAAEGAGAAA